MIKKYLSGFMGLDCQQLILDSDDFSPIDGKEESYAVSGMSARSMKNWINNNMTYYRFPAPSSVTLPPDDYSVVVKFDEFYPDYYAAGVIQASDQRRNSLTYSDSYFANAVRDIIGFAMHIDQIQNQVQSEFNNVILGNYQHHTSDDPLKGENNAD